MDKTMMLLRIEQGIMCREALLQNRPIDNNIKLESNLTKGHIIDITSLSRLSQPGLFAITCPNWQVHLRWRSPHDEIVDYAKRVRRR